MNNIKIFNQDTFEDTIKNFFSGVEDSRLKDLFRIRDQYELLFNRFRGACSIWQSQIKDIKRQFPTARIDLDKDITKLIQDGRVDVFFVNDVIQLQPNPVV